MKIALIAMSGIRACDEELLRLGLTLPGFVERSRVIASLPSLGLLTLAGMTPKHHECVYVEASDVREGAAAINGLDLVAISSYSAQIREAYQLADFYRAQGIRVVLGGLHASCRPEEAADHADAVVIGEGEGAWGQLLSDAERGWLQERYQSEAFDMSEAPMPAFELLDIDRYNRLTVQASRGCPFRCEFCASSILLTSRYKQKPIAKVLAEIDRICELWTKPFIEFADDNSFVNRRYWKSLLSELKTRSIRWFTETDLSVHEDDELLRLMRESGCAEVLIGFESPLPEGLHGLEMKTDWKAKQWPKYVDAVRRIQSRGVRVNACFILGLDGHTTAVFDAVYDFVRQARPFDVQITIQTPFPGTPLYERLRRAGRLLEEDAWERCTLFDINYRPDPMTVDELRDGFRDLAKRLYSEEETRWRRAGFHHQARRATSVEDPPRREPCLKKLIPRAPPEEKVAQDDGA